MPKRKHSSNFYRLVNKNITDTLELVNGIESVICADNTSKGIDDSQILHAHANSLNKAALISNNKSDSISNHQNIDNGEESESDQLIIDHLKASDTLEHDVMLSNEFNSIQDVALNNIQLNNVASLFRLGLQSWALEDHITHSSLTKLLRLLKTLPINLNLPSSAKSLLKTPRNHVSKNVAPGSYIHLGLLKAIYILCKNLSNLPEKLELLINIDGLPLSKSSASQLYPILCSLYGYPDKVSLIGLYHGYEKPSVANDFLQDFKEEISMIIRNGCEIDGKMMTVCIKGFVCDAPAKSFISYRKGHSGYYSCSKCTQKGIYIKGRVCFAKTKFKKRTDDDFIRKLQPEHHTGTSILEDIPGIGMVSSFPLEYMHLVCLGVVKKLIVNIWMFGKPPNRLSPQAIQDISNLYTSYRNYCPVEFSRKSRSIEEAKRWKATEFRFFLLYLGPVVLQNYISDEKYVNFLSLHIAIRILASDMYKNQSLLKYANSLLQYHVETFGNLYGPEYISHNVHGLLHITDDVKNFGSLDLYSAFGFENDMQCLKKMVRKAENPLAQIWNRLHEVEYLIQATTKTEAPQCNYTLHQVYSGGFLLPNFMGNIIEYKMIKFKKFELNLRSGNNVCILKNHSVVEILNIIVRDSDTFIIGKIFMKKSNYYNQPCKSSLIGIYYVSERNTVAAAWPVDAISNKLVAFSLNNGYVIFPLLHVNPQC